MRRLILLICTPGVFAHDPVTTKLTWSREISRLLAARCQGCHQTGGQAPFSLRTYAEARPWAVAMREEVAARRMPPWNAVRGFGKFAGDASLSPAEIHMLTDWVNGGAPEGEPRGIDSRSVQLVESRRAPDSGGIRASDRMPLAPGMIAGVQIKALLSAAPVRLLIEQPDGRLLPLAWLQRFSVRAPDYYEFAEPVSVSPGSKLRMWAPAGTEGWLFASPFPNPPAGRE